MIKFTVPGRPVPAVRMTRRSKHVDPAAKRYLAYKSYVKVHAKNEMVKQRLMTSDKPIEVGMVVTYGLPKSWSKKRKQAIIDGGYEEFPHVRGDIDNIVKSITDACNAIVYLDDIQIVDLKASKRYGETDKVDVWINELN